MTQKVHFRLTEGSLSKDVFERRTSTGDEAFSLFISLDANKFVLLSFFSLIKTIYPRFWTNALPNDAKSPLPVDVRRSKTLGSLSKDVFERRTSTGDEAFSLFISLDANKFVLLSFFSLIKTIYPRFWTNALLNDAKSRCSLLLLELPIIGLTLISPRGIYLWLQRCAVSGLLESA